MASKPSASGFEGKENFAPRGVATATTKVTERSAKGPFEREVEESANRTHTSLPEVKSERDRLRIFDLPETSSKENGRQYVSISMQLVCTDDDMDLGILQKCA